jgi:hypothetical protein
VVLLARGARELAETPEDIAAGDRVDACALVGEMSIEQPAIILDGAAAVLALARLQKFGSGIVECGVNRPDLAERLLSEETPCLDTSFRESKRGPSADRLAPAACNEHDERLSAALADPHAEALERAVPCRYGAFGRWR